MSGPADDYDESFNEPDGNDDAGAFECAAYWTGKEWHCPLAGSEECDWECAEQFPDAPGAGEPPLHGSRKP